MLALVAGAGGGLGLAAVLDDDGEPSADGSGELAELRDELEAVRDELGQVRGQRDDLKHRLDEARAALAEAETSAEAPADPPAEPPADATPLDGSFTAGEFTFAEVEVREDVVGDFEVGAQVTNDGDETVSYVSWTATVLLAGEPVSTLTASAIELAAGDTVEVTFIGYDEFGEWDSVEFQVDPTL